MDPVPGRVTVELEQRVGIVDCFSPNLANRIKEFEQDLGGALLNRASSHRLFSTFTPLGRPRRAQPADGFLRHP
jgi:hypothetical protein